MVLIDIRICNYFIRPLVVALIERCFLNCGGGLPASQAVGMPFPFTKLMSLEWHLIISGMNVPQSCNFNLIRISQIYINFWIKKYKKGIKLSQLWGKPEVDGNITPFHRWNHCDSLFMLHLSCGRDGKSVKMEREVWFSEKERARLESGRWSYQSHDVENEGLTKEQNK